MATVPCSPYCCMSYLKKKKNPINCDVGSYLSYCIVIKILSTCILVERETLKKISSVKSGE